MSKRRRVKKGFYLNLAITFFLAALTQIGDARKAYLKIDEEKDYVLQTLPCPFLGAENLCSIYENRPKGCREYPHTDRKKVYQINHLTLKNTLICPAAYEVVEKMMEKI